MTPDPTLAEARAWWSEAFYVPYFTLTDADLLGHIGRRGAEFAHVVRTLEGARVWPSVDVLHAVDLRLAALADAEAAS